MPDPSASNPNHSARPRIHWGRLALLPVVVSLAFSACVGPLSRIGSDVRDFKLVAYQGEDQLGGRETTFARVFQHGKPVVLNFWAGNCPPCQAEMPAFQRVADDYRDEVIFVGVDVGRFTGLGSLEDGRALLSSLSIRFPTGYAVDATPVQEYNVRSMPTTLFFNAKGKIVKAYPGMLLEDAVRRNLDEMLQP